MGVLACDRRECENIMCDRFSAEYGYLCWECFEELLNQPADINLRIFMDTPRRNNSRAAQARFEAEFVLTWRNIS